MNFCKHGLTVLLLSCCLHAAAQDSLSVPLHDADLRFLQQNLLLAAGRYQVAAQEAMEIQAKLYPNPELTLSANLYDTDNRKLLYAGTRGEKGVAFEQLLLLGGKRKAQLALAKTSSSIARNELESLLRSLQFVLHKSLISVHFDLLTLRKYDLQLANLTNQKAKQELVYQKSLAYPDLKAGLPYAQRGAAFNNQLSLNLGILALHVTGMNFGISAGVGFIALFGICVQNGVILISEWNKRLKQKLPLAQAILEGVRARTRPVVMTAMMAALGLHPAALSTGIGSESQKPLAIVIIGGLLTATLLTLLIFPIIYWIFYRKTYRHVESL